jgi:hypothetical protein
MPLILFVHLVEKCGNQKRNATGKCSYSRNICQPLDPPLTGMKTLVFWSDRGRSIQCRLMPRHACLAPIESWSVCRFDSLFRCNRSPPHAVSLSHGLSTCWRALGSPGSGKSRILNRQRSFGLNLLLYCLANIIFITHYMGATASEVIVPGYRSRGPGSIPGATRFSEK